MLAFLVIHLADQVTEPPSKTYHEKLREIAGGKKNDFIVVFIVWVFYRKFYNKEERKMFGFLLT
jgi:hypothetical protein